MVERALGVDRSDPEAPDPVYDEAREHLYQRTVIEAVTESGKDVLELPREPEWTSFEEGVGATYEVTLPVRPEVELGDYTEYPFEPHVEEVTDEQVDQVIEQLRDQQASLIPVEDRGAENEDFAVISFEGRRDGEPVEGAQSDRFPLVLGKERMIPGFEANLLGMKEEDERTFTVTFPEDYAEESLQGAEVEFTPSCWSCASASCPRRTTTSPASWVSTTAWPHCAPTSASACASTPSIAPATSSWTASSSTPTAMPQWRSRRSSSTARSA